MSVPITMISSYARGLVEQYRRLQRTKDYANAGRFKASLERVGREGLEATERHACKEALRVIQDLEARRG